MSIQVIGGGLAGVKPAWQIARRGVPVDLYEMKPCLKTPAQHLDTMAELVCSNSLRSDRLSNAVGLLKAEMRMLDSLIMRAADENAVPARRRTGGGPRGLLRGGGQGGSGASAHYRS